MFTTFVIVFVTTFLIVFVIRIAIKKFTELHDPPVPVRCRAPAQYTEPVSQRVYTIETTAEPVISYHRSPPPEYNQSVLNNIQYQIPRNPAKEIVIINDKDLPSYEDVIAEKARETNETIDEVIINASTTNDTTTTATTTTTITQTHDVVANSSLRNDNNNRNNINQCNNKNICNTTTATATMVRVMVDTPLHVPSRQS